MNTRSFRADSAAQLSSSITFFLLLTIAHSRIAKIPEKCFSITLRMTLRTETFSKYASKHTDLLSAVEQSKLASILCNNVERCCRKTSGISIRTNMNYLYHCKYDQWYKISDLASERVVKRLFAVNTTGETVFINYGSYSLMPHLPVMENRYVVI